MAPLSNLEVGEVVRPGSERSSAILVFPFGHPDQTAGNPWRRRSYWSSVGTKALPVILSVPSPLMSMYPEAIVSSGRVETRLSHLRQLQMCDPSGSHR